MVPLQGHVMQQQSRRRLPSLHAIGRSRCVDVEDTPTEPAWLPPCSTSTDHHVDKDDDEMRETPPTRLVSLSQLVLTYSGPMVDPLHPHIEFR